MARHKSALKAARQSEKRKARNITVRSQCKTALKKVRVALAGKYASAEEKKKALDVLFRDAQKSLMKAANKGIFKSGTASRYIARLGASIHRSASK